MKLTKEREQAALAAFCEDLSIKIPDNEYCLREGVFSKWIFWKKATEWKQDEIDVWCAKLKAHEKLERDARFENAKLRKVVDKYARHLSSCDIFPLHTGGPAGPCSCELNDALSKAGIDQREAKGDGDRS